MGKMSAARREQEASDFDANELSAAEHFLAELTELSIKHGIAVSGEAVLYVMVPDDHEFRYAIDDESRLIRA